MRPFRLMDVRWLSALLMVALLSSSTGSVFAQEEPDGDDPAETQLANQVFMPLVSSETERTVTTLEEPLAMTAEEILAQSADSYAERFGVDVNEALKRLERQDSVSELGQQLWESEQNTFGGLWIQHEPEYRIVAAFTQNGEVTLNKYIADIEFSNYVEIREVDVTVDALVKLQETEVLPLLEEMAPLADSDVNIQENRVDVLVEKGTLSSQEVRAAATNPKIAFVEVDSLSAEIQGEVRAGQALSNCTVGFNVSYNSSRYMSTAGHCPPTQRYNGILLTPVSGAVWYGGPYDLRLFHAPAGYSLPNKYNTSYANTITSARSKIGTEGHYVCHIGKTSGFKCGVISSLYSYVGTTGLGPFVKFSTSSACPGDSGGPVLNSTVGYGIMAAGNCSSIGQFMPVDSMRNLGVSLVTSP